MSSDQSSGKTWQLSLYEKHRKPQDIIISNEEIAVSPRSLHSELMCPICLDMLKNTMTTKECLHRFCQDCIITALRNGNKECPTCRKKLISKRSLRPDPNFDELISKIYPSRDEYEAQQERVLAKISKQNLGNFDDSNCDTENNKKKLNFENDGDETETEQFMSETSNQNTEQDIEVIFIPLNINNKKLDSNLMETRYIKTTINATIDHLVKYLSMRYILDCKNGNTQTNDDLMKHVNDEASLFTIYQAGGPGEFKPLNGQKSLKQIATDIYDSLEKYKKINKPLELHYAYKMPTV